MANCKKTLIKNLIKDKRGAGLRPFVLSLLMVVLGAFFIILFAFNFISITNPSSEVLNEKYYLNHSINGLQNSLDDFSKVSNDVKSQLADASPSAVDYLFLIFKEAFYIPIAFLSFVFNGIVTLATVIFVGTSSSGLTVGWQPLTQIMAIVSGVVMAGLLVTVIFLIVQSIRTGQSER